MKKNILLPVIGLGLFLLFTTCTKDQSLPLFDDPELDFRGESYDWNHHDHPYDFLFGNHFDTHQQTKVAKNGKLTGFFYITFTGDYTADGIPIAKHGNCSKNTDGCTVGWKLHGIPVRARLVAHGHGQHPTWCIDPADLPVPPGYTHFHWLGHPDHVGHADMDKVYDGYLLKLTARERFFFDHHGGFLVEPGIDYETHANIVTDCP